MNFLINSIYDQNSDYNNLFLLINKQKTYKIHEHHMSVKCLFPVRVTSQGSFLQTLVAQSLLCELLNCSISVEKDDRSTTHEVESGNSWPKKSKKKVYLY